MTNPAPFHPRLDRLPMTDASEYRLAEHTASTALDDDSTVVLHLNTQTYFELNETGALLWDVLSEEDAATENDLVNAVADAYPDADRSAVTEDVRAFLTSMQDADLVNEA